MSAYFLNSMFNLQAEEQETILIMKIYRTTEVYFMTWFCSKNVRDLTLCKPLVLYYLSNQHQSKMELVSLIPYSNSEAC
ncbi:hypothetical protein GCM10011607_19930 [Shewanella inventionis]|uniref:Uncharacterized protein n=1 Tax=Shewanella inventionis TaxID=1738770 RepID=A0ABQ1J7D5_9GAMM|nr:hypothetical protein GCM10011607_19930 [Shewanella inventionis]